MTVLGGGCQRMEEYPIFCNQILDWKQKIYENITCGDFAGFLLNHQPWTRHAAYGGIMMPVFQSPTSELKFKGSAWWFFTNPFENYADRQIESWNPKGSGWKQKNIWNHHLGLIFTNYFEKKLFRFVEFFFPCGFQICWCCFLQSLQELYKKKSAISLYPEWVPSAAKFEASPVTHAPTVRSFGWTDVVPVGPSNTTKVSVATGYFQGNRVYHIGCFQK